MGNWLEDMCLEEEKLSEFSRSQENGSLIMNDLYKKQAVYNKRVALSRKPNTGLGGPDQT